jgi:hypothetical protein
MRMFQDSLPAIIRKKMRERMSEDIQPDCAHRSIVELNRREWQIEP